jgi:poly(beta-D-mannuronate) lyase
MANGIWADEDIDFFGNGEDGQPILLRAETPGHVILTGKSRMDIYGSYLVVDGLYFLNGSLTLHKVHVISINSGSDHCRLTNIAVVNYNPPGWELYYKWLEVKGQYHRIDHCYFSGKTHRDAMVKIVIPSDTSYAQFDHNYLGEVAIGKTNNNWEALRIQGEPAVTYGQVIVEDNLFYGCNGEIEIISLKAGDNDIRRNTFYESIGTLTCRKNEGNRIYGNFFIGNGVEGTGGVRMYSKDHVVYSNYFEDLAGDNEWRAAIAFMTAQVDTLQPEDPEVENILVAFNTIVNCEKTIEVGVGRSLSSGRIVPPRNLTIANNIAYKTTGEMIHYLDDVGAISYEGNIMFSAPLGIPATAGIAADDPLLLVAADGLWRPADVSPAIDGAVGDYSNIMLDMDGQQRSDGQNDVGADELSAEPIVSRPLTREDVGPDWIHNPDLPVALSITMEGSGSGVVTVDPPGGIYDKGTEVTLVALPDGAHSFAGWSGDTTATGDTLTVVMDGHKRIVAIFDAPPAYDFSIWVNGSGQVQFEPPTGPYPEGTVVTLTAMPDSGWMFSHWSGALSGSANPDSVAMDENKAIVVTFDPLVDIKPIAHTPTDYWLKQNFPNPFNPTTTITFALKGGGPTTLVIYDLTGREVSELVNRYLEAGIYKFEYNAHSLSSGVFLYRLTSGEFTSIKKMVLLQ